VSLLSVSGATIERCVTCPDGTAPNSARTQCLPTSGSGLTSTSPTQDLQYVISALNLGINIGSATQVLEYPAGRGGLGFGIVTSSWGADDGEHHAMVSLGCHCTAAAH
jgi:hypothetical protein